jgi:xanthine dehydrogenase large subunit
LGQGLHTKVMQVVAHELGVNLEQVRIAATDTGKVANTSATAASTGADLNGKAAQDAARKIRDRLAAFAVARHGGDVADVVFADNHVHVNGQSIRFPVLVAQAYLMRVQLWSDGFYATPDLQWDAASMTGHPFSYYAYAAAVSEVIVDTLTGEWKLLRVDALYDAGQSLNPAIDIGQVEGAFIQGMGWLTTEQLWWNEQGRLMTHAPSTYKIPAISDCPNDFRVRLFKNRNVVDSIHRSKATGEPPLLLPFSVFFAIRDAIASVGGYRINPPLNAPATCEEILNAVEAVRTAGEADHV